MVNIQASGIPYDKGALSNLGKEFGVEFPKSYVEFLEKYNGGFPDRNIIEISGSEFNSISITSFFGLHEGGIDDLISQNKVYSGRIHVGYVPIARTEGGNIVCINLLPTGYGKIFLWDHDSELLLETPIGEDQLIFISDTFDDFLDEMKLVDEDENQDYEVQSVWIDPDFLKSLE